MSLFFFFKLIACKLPLQLQVWDTAACQQSLGMIVRHCILGTHSKSLVFLVADENFAASVSGGHAGTWFVLIV